MVGENYQSSDKDFLRLAQKAKEESTCLRRQVGAVLVKDGEVIGRGASGPAGQLKSCLEVGCVRNQKGIASGREEQICRSVCAEQKALFAALSAGVSVAGGTLYATAFPCAVCSRIMIYLGIEKVVYEHEYNDDFSRQLLAESEVEVVKIPSLDE
jgi:dCMP deaminase